MDVNCHQQSGSATPPSTPPRRAAAVGGACSGRRPARGQGAIAAAGRERRGGRARALAPGADDGNRRIWDLLLQRFPAFFFLIFFRNDFLLPCSLDATVRCAVIADKIKFGENQPIGISSLPVIVAMIFVIFFRCFFHYAVSIRLIAGQFWQCVGTFQISDRPFTRLIHMRKSIWFRPPFSYDLA